MVSWGLCSHTPGPAAGPGNVILIGHLMAERPTNDRWRGEKRSRTGIGEDKNGEEIVGEDKNGEDIS